MCTRITVVCLLPLYCPRNILNAIKMNIPVNLHQTPGFWCFDLTLARANGAFKKFNHAKSTALYKSWWGNDHKRAISLNCLSKLPTIRQMNVLGYVTGLQCNICSKICPIDISPSLKSLQSSIPDMMKAWSLPPPFVNKTFFYKAPTSWPVVVF